jgi:hypothetical protein
VLSISEHGGSRTPRFVARNQGTLPILILDCEEVPGGVTNRSTSRSILLGPNSTTEFPVSCMEGGRRFPTDREMELSEALEAFPTLVGQVGLMVFLGQQFLGMDALGSPALYAPLHRRLLAGYLIETLASKCRCGGWRPTSEAEVLALAEALEMAERVPSPTDGQGDYSTLQGAVAGGELRHNGHLVHLSVFPAGLAA